MQHTADGEPYRGPPCHDRNRGREASCVTAIGSSGFFLVADDRSNTLTAGEVRAVVDGLRFADPADRHSWVAVDP